MMDAQSLQERITQVENKRALLLKFQIDPTLSTLSIDIEQALIEMDDLMRDRSAWELTHSCDESRDESHETGAVSQEMLRSALPANA